MQNIAELRSFLRALCGEANAPSRIPSLLRVMARQAARGDEQTAQDLVNEVCVDLLERSGQAGSVERLLALSDADLKAALRRRLSQVSAIQAGSQSRLVKSLRAHVAVALSSPRLVVEELPVSLLKCDRLDSEAVRKAVAALHRERKRSSVEVRTTASELMTLYFQAPAATIEGPETTPIDNEIARRVDAHRIANELRALVGPVAIETFCRRARGLTHDAGGVAPSTAHGRLAKALNGARAVAQQHDLEPSDFASVLEVLAA